MPGHLRQRHGGALALQTVGRADESGPTRAAGVRAEPVISPRPAAQVLPLRREPAAAPDRASEPLPTAQTASAEALHGLQAQSAPEHRPDFDQGELQRPSQPPPPPRASDVSGRLTPSAQSAARPPVLASEAMRKELSPAAPASRPARFWIAVLGLIGLLGAWFVCGPHGLGVPVGGAFLALTMLGMVPMAYPARAAAVVTVAGSGLTVLVAQRFEHAASLEPLVLMVGVMVLAMALLFRSWHRASLLARALVALGVALCAGWLWMGGSLQQLLVLDRQWQAWLLPVLTVPFALILLLSLLAFMDSRSTGACGAWAAALLIWYALYTWVELLVVYWPAGSAALDSARMSADTAMTVLSAPLFASALALGLAQLLAVATATDE
jgi:hypothetical protein